jgi:hypothetical protein
MDFNEMVDEAKQLDADNPDQAKTVLEKAEGILDERRHLQLPPGRHPAHNGL